MSYTVISVCIRIYYPICCIVLADAEFMQQENPSSFFISEKKKKPQL